MKIERNSHVRRIVEALRSGAELDARRAAEVAFCTVRSANRYFAALRAVRLVHVVSWERRHYVPVPVYAFGAGKDAPAPAPLTESEKQRRYRQRHRIPSLRRRCPLERALAKLSTMEIRT